MVNNNDKGVIISALTFLLVCGICISVSSVVIAVQDKDDDCIRGNRGGIDIADWLLGQGIDGLIACVIYIVCITLVCADSTEAAKFVGITWFVLNVLFGIIWTIWGIVVISTNENNKCIDDGTRIGVFSLVLIILQFIGLFCSRAHDNNNTITA